jgi:predicted Zn-dependent protease with MMP-like domain
MDLKRFKQLVEKTLEDLPKEFREKLENVIIEVRRRATRAEMQDLRLDRSSMLLGLYQGVPLTARPHDFGGHMPDKITIFQEPIESQCRSDEEVEQALRTTLVHELGHYFGIDEKRLQELGFA